MSYSSNYQEKGVIGRGNFGTLYTGMAVLVTSLSDNNFYVAKKIILGGMSEKEINGAHQEATILKSLSHPNIVKYIESYCEKGELIIIMEYCEVGDLSHHVKEKRSNNDTFTEVEIMNWFLQICMALQYVHSQGILHRDIKTSNIYLTGNNTVKLGDFGISRVLQSAEAAMSVVGTPYYMSPEVCEGKPYSYKSDVWALGCVLYELCTLKHAFNANNLLGLVYKIVSETAEPILSPYSLELKTLVSCLLEKDVERRVSIQHIMKDEYVAGFLQGFIRTNGQNTVRSVTKRKTITRQPQGSPEETPRERMVRAKREKAERDEEVLKQATRKAFHDNQVTKQRKRDMLYSSPQERAHNQARVQHLMPSPMDLSSSGTTIASLAFTNHKASETLAQDFSDLSMSEQDLNTAANYENFLKHTSFEDSLTYSNSFTGGPLAQIKANPYDETPIRASGSYDLSALAEESSEIAQGDEVELTQVVDRYLQQMERNQRNSSSDEGPTELVVDRTAACRRKCMLEMGTELFREVYAFVKGNLVRGTSDSMIRSEAVARWGRKGVNYCFLVDQLVFSEIVSSMPDS